MGGPAWIRLHRWIYLAGVLATIHYFMQSKLAVGEPLVVAGLFVWMMLYRVVLWTAGTERASGLPVIAGLGASRRSQPESAKLPTTTWSRMRRSCACSRPTFTGARASVRPGWFSAS